MEKFSNKLVDLSVSFAVEILDLVKYLKSQHETIICNHVKALISYTVRNMLASRSLPEADVFYKQLVIQCRRNKACRFRQYGSLVPRE